MLWFLYNIGFYDLSLVKGTAKHALRVDLQPCARQRIQLYSRIIEATDP